MNKDPFGFWNYKIQAKILVAAFSVIAERAFRSFLPTLLWIGLFLCLWLADYASRNTSIVFWLGMTAGLLFGLRRFKFPSQQEILQRVESASGLPHRPLQNAQDTRLNGSEELWEHEKNRQRKLLSRLKFTRPLFSLADSDPFALRVFILMFIACAVAISPGTAWNKIEAGMFPPLDFAGDISAKGITGITIEPPAYSGLPTLQLDQSSLNSIGILKGSIVRAHIESRWGDPSLHIGNQKIPMQRKSGSDIWNGEGIFDQGGPIKITRYAYPLLYQPAHLINDRPPEISWNGDILALPSGEIKIPLKVKDDFGISKLTLRGILPAGTAQPIFGSPLKIEKKMNLPVRDNTEIAPVFDATGHVWAGSTVTLLVEAEDYAGNIAETTPQNMLLPQRQFTKPVAAQIALVRSDILNLKGNAASITASIEDILYRPDLYDWNMMATLGLRSAATRMEYATNIATIESTAGILWSVAMEIEDGNITETQDSLKDAISKLQDAILKGADKAELARLMQEMQQALIRHLQNITAQNAREAQKNESQIQRNVNVDALQKFMQELQKSLMSGDRDSAMNKLNNLQQLADMLGSSATKELPKEIRETMQSIERLQKIITDQKKLLDATRASPEKDLPARRPEQDKISSATSDVTEKTPDPSLSDAKKSMDQSSQALAKHDAGQSVFHQQQALEHLQKSHKSMQQKLQQQMQNVISLGGQSPSTDPLGRNPDDPNEKIDMNGKGGRKKSEAIIRTLREREGDMTRPLEERNYYERLLRQW